MNDDDNYTHRFFLYSTNHKFNEEKMHKQTEHLKGTITHVNHR